MTIWSSWVSIMGGMGIFPLRGLARSEMRSTPRVSSPGRPHISHSISIIREMAHRSRAMAGIEDCIASVRMCGLELGASCSPASLWHIPWPS